MKIILSLFILASTSCATSSKDPGFVTYQRSERPIFLADSLYPILKKNIPDMPAPGSAAQIADEQELLKIQKTRTQKQCELAEAETKTDLVSLFAKPHGPLELALAQKYSALFDIIRNDADFYIRMSKDDYGRKRPYEYIKGLEPCTKKAKSPAYPSGHATIGRLCALVLSDIFPKLKTEIMKHGDQVGTNRVLGGNHHPTDVIAGQKLADALYIELKKSEKFKAELAKLNY